MGDKEKEQAAKDAAANAASAETAPPAATAPAEAPATAPDPNTTDSTGAKKTETLIGPRGLNVPRGIKPEPAAQPERNPTGGNTKKRDSAGNKKSEAIPIGPRGEGAEKIARESFNHDARK